MLVVVYNSDRASDERLTNVAATRKQMNKGALPAMYRLLTLLSLKRHHSSCLPISRLYSSRYKSVDVIDENRSFRNRC